MDLGLKPCQEGERLCMQKLMVSDSLVLLKLNYTENDLILYKGIMQNNQRRVLVQKVNGKLMQLIQITVLSLGPMTVMLTWRIL